VREFHGTATTQIQAPVDRVFALVTDIDRLPEWNQAIQEVAVRPPALERGAEWVVVMHPRGMPKWRSRSRVEEIERGIRFAHRTRTDDTNPTYALWRWEMAQSDETVQLTVSWDVYPKTLGRKLFAAPLRRRMLTREVAASLDAIRSTLEPATAGAV